jgi:serine/threonine protein phosphatase PrpC
LPDPLQFLSEVLTRAHYAINDYAVEHDLLEIPHTTCVASVIQDNMAYWAHVGDSRLYFFSEGKLIGRTEDHTAVARMVKDGLITEEEVAHHPDRNKVSNCLGGYLVPEVECAPPIPIHESDTLLLCTDGVWGSVSIAEMAAILYTYNLDDGVRHLMDHAEFRGGENGDNLSLVAMTWGDARLPSGETVSTLSLPEHGFSTQINKPESARAPTISDDEIERAIAEIQSAIKKLSREA